MKKMTQFFTFAFFTLFVQIGMSQDSWNNLEYSPDQKNIEYNPLKGLMPSFPGVNNDFPSSTEKFYIPLNEVFKNWNTYDWSALEDLLNKAAAKGHHCVPRFYMDYPGRTFAMPEFLRSSVNSSSYSSHGNSSSRSPDYKSEILMKALEEFIAAFGQRYNTDPRMGFIDIGLYGFWGEWHVYPNSDFEMPQANKDRLLSAYLKAFPNKKVMVRDSEATEDSSIKNSYGYYDDSFGLSTLNINWGFWEKMKSAGLTNSWKTHPMAGEVHPSINEDELFAKWPYVNRSYDNNFEDCIRITHATIMVKHGLFSSNNLNSTQYENALRATKLMGYQFFVKSVKLTPQSNNKVNVELNFQNRGIAPFYYDWKVELGAINMVDGSFKSISTSSFNLPEMQPSSQDYYRSVVTNALSKGDYKIVMRVQNPLRTKTPAAKPLRFANTTQDADLNEWITLGAVKVGSGTTEEDTIAPTITLVGESTINLTVGDTYTEQGATATDDVDGDLKSNIVITGNVDTDTEGSYIVSYNVSDAAGNAADEVSRTILVSEGEDTTAPIITLVGESTINLTVGDTYTEQGATAIDDVDGDLKSNIVITGNVDADTVGNYTVTYNVSDAAGNAAAEVSRTILVSEGEDTTAPIIALLGESTINLTVGDTYTEQGATASDDVDGDLKSNIVITGNVDTDTEGSYTVTYNVSDAAGNAAAEVSRTIIVTAEGDCNASYEEKNGLVVMEAENLSIASGWLNATSVNGYTGDGYLDWQGADSFGTPGNGKISTTIKISTPGTYLFQWRSKVGEGNNSTESNDSWLRFPDADDFFAQKGSSVVYPKGSGKTPNPNGAGADGWFKVYISGTTNWTWSSNTSDNDPHKIYVKFNTAGVYTMEISGRSKHHLIDRIVLSKDVDDSTNLSLNETECTGDNETISVTSVTLSPQTVSVDEGDTTTLVAQVVPSNASNKNITWSSSDTSIASVDQNGKVVANKEGNVVITVKAEDGGFTKTAAITVVALEEEDTTAPTITLLGESTINLTIGDTYTEQGATATDDVDGDLKSNIVITGNVDTDTEGSYIVSYNVSDAAGNAADEVSRTIIVSEEEDTTAPTITLLGESTINLMVGDTYTEPGATATDNVDVDLTPNIVITGNVDTEASGTYTVTYNVSDAAGNAADEVSRTILVSEAEDTTAPTITLLGESTINLTVGDTYTEPGATATDNVDVDLTSNIVIKGNVDTEASGTYTVTYNVSDAAGNAADEVSRTIIVSEEEDTTAPTITLLGESTINLMVGDTYTEQGATATDDVDGDISSDIVITGNVSTDVEGTYIVRYNVIDAAGNAADEVTRTVIVSTGNQTVSFSGITEQENLPVGSSILPIVNVSDTYGSIANVRLYINNKFIRQENAAPYEWGHKLGHDALLKNLGRGTYTLRAEVRGGGDVTVITLDFTVGGGVSSNGEANLFPIHDAYLENDRRRYNTDIVRVENNRRVAFLMFDVSQSKGEASNAVLQFKVASDAGYGNVNVYLGTSNNWTENDLNRSNKPGLGKLVGSLDSRYAIGSLIEIPLLNLPAITGDRLSLVLEATDGNDFAFSSKEGGTAHAPILKYKLPVQASKYEAIKVYPNPSSDRVTLEKVANENTELLVYDMYGKVVLQTIVSPTSKTIEISELSTGLYFIFLDGIQRAKFVRE